MEQWQNVGQLQQIRMWLALLVQEPDARGTDVSKMGSGIMSRAGPLEAVDNLEGTEGAESTQALKCLRETLRHLVSLNF